MGQQELWRIAHGAAPFRRRAGRGCCHLGARQIGMGQIVHEYPVSRYQGGNQNLFHVGEESGPVHRPIQDHMGGVAIQAQSGSEGGCLPMSMRYRGTATSATL